MTYDEQLDELLACTDKELARVWLMREIARYEVDYHKTVPEARRQIIQNLMNTALARDMETWERAVALLIP